jgi:DNA-binding transcriptional MerR regulator
MNRHDDDEDLSREQSFLLRVKRTLGYPLSDNRRTADEEDEEEEDDDEVLDPEITLLQLLYDQDSCQTRLQRNRTCVASLLRRYPELRQRWQQFQKSGGISASDFELFMSGKLRPRVVRQQKHLRLVSNRKTTPLKLIKPNNGGEAA